MAKVKPIGGKPATKVKKDFLAIKIIVFVIFTLYAASLIFAILYAFSISLKDVDEFHEKNLLPKEWLFSNYGQAFKEVKAGDSNMFVMLWNSIWYACGGAALGVFTSAITSYVVAKYRFPGRNIIYWMAIVTMMIPIVGAFPAQYLVYNNLGIYNNTNIIEQSIETIGNE